MIRDVLEQYLYKVGVLSYDDLSPEEKETYKSWERSLKGRKLTDEDVSEFFEREIYDIQKKITVDTNSDKLDTFLKMKLEFILAIQTFLASPKIEAEITEQGIRSFIQQN